jgi:S-adenosylmethionine hydrolase
MKNSPLITLLTDFGTRDGYVGMIKGVIRRINPKIEIIDLCHEIPPQDIFEAAYILHTSYRYFPQRTIHLSVVDPGVGTGRKIVCLKTKDYFFLAPDNGLLTFILENEKIEKMVEVTSKRYSLKTVSNTFHGRDIFAPLAAHLSLGLDLGKLGRKVKSFEKIEVAKPVLSSKGTLKGRIIHIDPFGNLVTNISRDIFEYFSGKFPRVKIRIRIGREEISRISKSYAESKPGELLALFGSANFLEVSLNRGSAQKFLGSVKGEEIKVEKGGKL